MADRKPLVLDGTGQTEQLQSGDDLDIPLEQRHAALAWKFDQLVWWLQMEGFDVPSELRTLE
jgi:hypothetical protein